MKKILLDGIAAAEKKGASYAEARFSDVQQERLEEGTGNSSCCHHARQKGIAVRVLVDGYWGFAAAPAEGRNGIDKLVQQAVDAARQASCYRLPPVTISTQPGSKGEYHTPVHKDPFDVLLAEKEDLLQHVDVALQGENVVKRQSWLAFRREEKILVSTLEVDTEQTLYHSAAGCSLTVRTERGSQTRSWPGPRGRWFSGGFEKIVALDMPSMARPLVQEAEELCGVSPCQRGVYDVVLAGDALALVIRETLGYLLEMDNYLNLPQGIRPPLGGAAQATPCVSLTSDPAFIGGAGTYGFDDEGVAARETKLIQEGVLTSLLSNRETGPKAGGASNGSARAASWEVPPLVRISNLLLKPGYGSRKDLIGQVEKGLYIDTAEGISLDSLRSNFRLVGESGRLIYNGRLTSSVPYPAVEASSEDFWHACNAVAGVGEWEVWGVEDEKGAPLQVLPVGIGLSPALFRRVKAGGLS